MFRFFRWCKVFKIVLFWLVKMVLVILILSWWGGRLFVVRIVIIFLMKCGCLNWFGDIFIDIMMFG